METLDHGDQYFEARLEKSLALIKLGIEKIMAFDESKPLLDPRDEIMMTRDEEVRWVDGQMFRKTYGNH